MEGGMIGTVMSKIQGVIQTHWLATFVVIVALIIFSMAMMFGWIGSASEGIAGSISPAALQIRDGPGEVKVLGSAVQGFVADPESFCKDAGTPTDDPWGYLAEQMGGRSETMANPDALDAQLVYASQH